MDYLFSYGTLQRPAVQIETFGEIVTGQPDALVGFVQTLIEMTDPKVLALSGARFHPIVTRTQDPNDRVAGTVFALSAAQLAKADAYEVDDYERATVRLASGKTAWLYMGKA
jgi:hypothetical protein